MKRCFDLVLCIIALLLLAPLLVVIACLVILQDGKPIFYRQERVGYKGRVFRIWKFRSMQVNADKFGESITKSGDPRVTPVGAWLRKTKLDELPQLLNVFRGEMSFVGPRPEVPKYVQFYTPEQRKVLDLMPGITDLASVEFRNEEELLAKADNMEDFYVNYCIPRKIELNLKHASRASIWADLSVILATLKVLVRRQRASRTGSH